MSVLWAIFLKKGKRGEWRMIEIQGKSFEQYENEVSYFAYTHDEDDYDSPFCDEYYKLDETVINAVRNRGTQDRIEKRPMINAYQLAEFIVSEGLLSKEMADIVKYDLHLEYMLAYEYFNAKTLKGKKKNEST